jgi:hypothetical protein
VKASTPASGDRRWTILSMMVFIRSSMDDNVFDLSPSLVEFVQH